MGVDCLNGTTCKRVFEHYPGNFTFELGPASLAIDCLWRIVTDGKLHLLPVITASSSARRLRSMPTSRGTRALNGKNVVAVRLVENLADLFLDFDGGSRLEIFSDSSGYEPWNLQAPGIHLVALGGGKVADFSSRG